MTDDPPLAPARHRTGLRTILLIVLIAFATGIAATALFLRQYRMWQPTATQMPVANVESATAAPSVPFMPPPEVGPGAPTADDRIVAMRMATLAAQLAALEARANSIDRDSRGAAANAGRAEAMLTVFAARRALDRGLALGYVEGLLRTRFATSQPREVAAIVAASQAPVTIADLRIGLDAIAPDLATGTTKDGWWAGFQRELSGLIVLHRDNLPSPRPADRLARARQSLEAGQVEAALLEVSRLPGASTAMAWTAAARRYIDARHALDTLEAAALQGTGAAPAIAAPAPVPSPTPAPAGATPNGTAPR
ncbi:MULTISPECIES: hypothetical protein [Sphingomonas]|uniref:hypothetical protein n=1 Tax=Sphingomonas TaxID=13687 RepID=UPI00082BC110|nr:hypothetical protein [Sphingomonas sp. CCH10-B3]